MLINWIIKSPLIQVPNVGRTVMALSDAWVIRDFRLFVLGDTASKFGRATFMTAVGWKVAEIGGPKAFGMIMTAYFLAHLPYAVFAVHS